MTPSPGSIQTRATLIGGEVDLAIRFLSPYDQSDCMIQFTCGMRKSLYPGSPSLNSDLLRLFSAAATIAAFFGGPPQKYGLFCSLELA